MAEFYPLRIDGCSPGTLQEFQPTDTLNDILIASSSVLQHEALLDHDNILNGTGINSHSQIDTHISTGGIHFTEASIDHANILNGGGINSHVQIDTHISDGLIHFTEASIDHNNLINSAGVRHRTANYQRIYAVNNVVTNTTATVPVVHLNINILMPAAGIVNLFWSYGWSHNSAANDIVVEIIDVGGTAGGAPAGTEVVHRLVQEPKDSAGPSLQGGTGTNQQAHCAGSIDLPLPGGLQNVNLQFNSSVGGVISSLFDARMILTVIS